MAQRVWRWLKAVIALVTRLPNMAVDDSKLYYLSQWDIDQLLATNSIAVGSGATAIYTISGDVPLPEYEVQFMPTGSTYWYEMGTASSDGTLAGTFTVYSYISGSSIFINAPTAGIARYFVWADKVNY
jgi:hypothetical protein